MTTTDSGDAAPPLGTLPRHIDIWTDGSCRPNPGFGGWAAILRNPEGQSRTFSGGETMTTNNRMELQAAIAGLSALKHPCRVVAGAASIEGKRERMKWLLHHHGHLPDAELVKLSGYSLSGVKKARKSSGQDQSPE